MKIKTHVEESLGANPAEAAFDPADSVAMGVPRWLASGRGQVFRALVHREYRLLFLAFLINQTGFWVAHLSIQGLTVAISHNDPLHIGMVFFSLFLPAFALAPLAGVAADRFDRKRIVVVCYVAVIALALALSALTHGGRMTMPWLFGLTFLLGSAFAFSGPANMAIAANSVPREDLSSAVSLQSALNNLTRVVGPMLAGPLVASGRFDVAFGLYAIAAGAAGILVARIRLTPWEPAAEEDLGILGRIASGFAHARERHPALPALAMTAMLSLFGASHVTVLSIYAQDRLGDVNWFPWIVSAIGAGALAGALVIGGRRPRLASAARNTVAYGVLLAGFGFSATPALAIGLEALIGFFYFAVMTELQTLIQGIVDESMRGRVMSLFQVCWAGLIPFGSLGMGAAAGALGVGHTLVLSGIACAACGVWMALRANAYAAAPRGATSA